MTPNQPNHLSSAQLLGTLTAENIRSAMGQIQAMLTPDPPQSGPLATTPNHAGRTDHNVICFMEN